MTPVYLLALAVSAQTDPTYLTVDSAIKIAEKNAFSIQTSNANLEKLRITIEQSRSGLGPSVTLNGQYTRFDRVFAGPLDQQAFNVQIAQPIDIMGNVKRAVRSSRASYLAGKENVETSKNDLHRDVRRAYIRVLQSKSLVNVQRENLKDRQATLLNTEQQFKAGVVANIDVLRSKAAVAQAKSDLIGAENNLQLAQEAFNNTLARPIDTPFVLEDLTDLPELPKDETALILQAQSNRPEIKGAKLGLDALRGITKVNERSMQPSLNLAIQPSYNPSPGFASFKTQVVGVLSLSFPLWDSGATRARVKSARQDEELANIQLRQALLGISLEVSQAVTNLKNARARLEVANEQLNFAEESHRLAILRYRAGEGIALEVTDAETALVQARTGVVNARYDYLSAHADLQRALGPQGPQTSSTGATK